MDPLEHCTITTTLRGFSSCDGRHSARADSECDKNRFQLFFTITFYANGSCTKNEGHVSILFNLIYDVFVNFDVQSATFSCTASVIDASGNKRFPQSFVFDSDDHSKRGIFHDGGFGRFVKRSTLLSDPSELLPDDSLTLCLEIDYNIIDRPVPGKLQDCYPMEFHKECDDLLKGNWFLRMDTGFAKSVCQMSSVFRDMMAFSSGSECEPVEEADEEANSFFLISRFLNESKLVLALSDLGMLLKVADKYDMQGITQLGFQLFSMMMRVANREQMLEDEENHKRISGFIEGIVDDESRKRLLAVYSAIKNKREDDNCEAEDLYAYKLKVEWSCEHVEGHIFEFNIKS